MKTNGLKSKVAISVTFLLTLTIDKRCLYALVLVLFSRHDSYQGVSVHKDKKNKQANNIILRSSDNCRNCSESWVYTFKKHWTKNEKTCTASETEIAF